MERTLVHATCVAIGEVGVLLTGASGSGKSDLALRLIDEGAKLVADDQTALSVEGGCLVARPPETIAGQIEARGYGILEIDYAPHAAVGLLVEVTPGGEPERLPDPAEADLLGVFVRRLALDPFAASAPAKLRLAAGRLAAVQQRPSTAGGSRRRHSVSSTTRIDQGPAQAETGARLSLVLITGMSGAGRSSALRALEDQGYEAIDNLPLGFLDAVARERGLARPLAIGVDTRTRAFAVEHFAAQIDRLVAEPGLDTTLVFVDCEDEVLARRFTETRRRHPLAHDRPIADGIKAERRLVTPLRARADLVIDTSSLTLGDLRTLLSGKLGLAGGLRMLVSVASFSYRYGLPREADLVFDVRFLANPHYQTALRPLTGRDPAVASYIESDPGYAGFFAGLTGMLDPLLPRFEAEGKSYLTLAVGCTGGRHRSVFVAERLAGWLGAAGRQVNLTHRDIERGSDPAGPRQNEERT